MQRTCPECNGAAVIESDAPCSTCHGRGYLLDKNKMPIPCNGGCSWGAVKVTETCPTCRGKGYVEVKT